MHPAQGSRIPYGKHAVFQKPVERLKKRIQIIIRSPCGMYDSDRIHLSFCMLKMEKCALKYCVGFLSIILGSVAAFIRAFTLSLSLC